MNAYDLAELRQRLEPKGMTVELKQAENLCPPLRKHVVMPGTMVCEMHGSRGCAMIYRTKDGHIFASWKFTGAFRMESILGESMKHCLDTIQVEIL